MAKKLENMTQDERIAHWEKVREQDKQKRQSCMNKLQPMQQAALYSINSKLDSFLETALYPDMGGIRAVSAFDLQELNDAWETLQHQFNLREA
jgi:hypothetical protein